MKKADATLILDKLDNLQGTLVAIKIMQADQHRQLIQINEAIAQIDKRLKRIETRSYISGA